MHLSEFAQDPSQYVEGDSVVIHCQTGYRAGVAAGFAEAAGLDVTVVVDDFSNFRGEMAYA